MWLLNLWMKQDRRCYLQLTRISNINHQRIGGGQTSKNGFSDTIRIIPGVGRRFFRVAYRPHSWDLPELTQYLRSLFEHSRFTLGSNCFYTKNRWCSWMFIQLFLHEKSDSDGRSTMYQPSAIRIETNKEDVNGKMCNDLDVYQSTMMGVYIYIYHLRGIISWCSKARNHGNASQAWFHVTMSVAVIDNVTSIYV